MFSVVFCLRRHQSHLLRTFTHRSVVCTRQRGDLTRRHVVTMFLLPSLCSYCDWLFVVALYLLASSTGFVSLRSGDYQPCLLSSSFLRSTYFLRCGYVVVVLLCNLCFLWAFCYYIVISFLCFLRAVKANFTISFYLTFKSVFSNVVVHLLVCSYSYFFARLKFGFSDLSRFDALLAPLGCDIRGAPYRITFIGDHFSWSLY